MSSPVVVIAGDFSFPSGAAASARMRNLAEGLASLGHRTSLCAFANQGDTSIFKEYASGVVFAPPLNGKLPFRNQGILVKLRWLVSIYGRSRQLVRSASARHTSDDVRLLVIYGRSYVLLKPFICWARARGIPVILDCVENNTSFAGFAGKFSPVYWDWSVGQRRLPLLVDAMSVITHTLGREAEARGCQRTLLFAAAEDFSAAPISHPARTGVFRIAYVGAMLARDNPIFLAELVDAVAACGAEVQFDILGRYESVVEAQPVVARLSAHVATGRVRLHGSLTDTELAATLNTADALILPRRDAPPEIAAFPTRLAECLRTARPVLVCAVGDIPYHLRDGEDAILLDPADVASAAVKVATLAKSPDRGRALGIRGYLRGRACFDRVTQAQALLSLANTIRNP
jgi:glycosyltransferase involved in cell wall biosynthesis